MGCCHWWCVWYQSNLKNGLASTNTFQLGKRIILLTWEISLLSCSLDTMLFWATFLSPSVLLTTPTFSALITLAHVVPPSRVCPRTVSASFCELFFASHQNPLTWKAVNRLLRSIHQRYLSSADQCCGVCILIINWLKERPAVEREMGQIGPQHFESFL